LAVEIAGRTRYAKCGDMEIAYQVIGDGAHDLVVLPAALIPIDSIADEPSMNRFHQRLASFCRVIRFDYRGTGLSSRVPSLDLIGPQFWAEDAIAVMDAVGCPKATIFVSGWASMIGIVLAANYPDRVNGLVIVNGAARFLWADDYPFGVKLSQSTALTTVAYELDAVEQGVDVLEWVAPSVAGVEAFRTWWDLAGNRGASPTMARAVGVMAVKGDVRDVLERITAPTLILHRRGSTFVPPGHGRYLAERITQSSYVELPGADMLYWVGDTAELLDEVGVWGLVKQPRFKLKVDDRTIVPEHDFGTSQDLHVIAVRVHLDKARTTPMLQYVVQRANLHQLLAKVLKTAVVHVDNRRCGGVVVKPDLSCAASEGDRNDLRMGKPRAF
jgi:pimeloyl-ACP methyl ester carboxylesterase